MAFVAGPYTPALGVEFRAENPAIGGGNVSSVAAVVKNISPLLLSVSSGEGAVVGLIDPFTTDLISLDAQAGQILNITPMSVGFLNLQTVTPTVYVTFYQGAEAPTGTYPYSIGGAAQLQIGGLLLAFQGNTGLTLSAGWTNFNILAPPPSGHVWRLHSAFIQIANAGATNDLVAILGASTLPPSLSGYGFTGATATGSLTVSEPLNGLAWSDGVVLSVKASAAAVVVFGCEMPYDLVQI